MGIGMFRRNSPERYLPKTEEVAVDVESPETSKVPETGTEGSGESTETGEGTGTTPETTEGSTETGEENTGEGKPEVEVPNRSATKVAWVEYFTETGREIPEGATRDSLAELVLGVKE